MRKKIELINTNKNTLMNYLTETLKDYNHKKLKSLLANQSVMVNNKIITKYDYQINPGDKIIIDRTGGLAYLNNNKIDILYEDDEIIAINKPYKMLTVETDTKDQHITAFKIVNNYVKFDDLKKRVFIVHRLDRETSGVIIFAKNPKIRKLLQDNWNDILIKRKYVAVIEGNLKKKEDTITSYLEENSEFMVYSIKDSEKGKKAITNYKVIKENKDYSMLDINIKTGRKNQIRVHMKDLKHPIIGDKKYGATRDPIKRLALHATELELLHPITKEVIKIKSEVPNLFNALF